MTDCTPAPFGALLARRARTETVTAARATALLFMAKIWFGDCWSLSATAPSSLSLSLLLPKPNQEEPDALPPAGAFGSTVLEASNSGKAASPETAIRFTEPVKARPRVRKARKSVLLCSCIALATSTSGSSNTVRPLYFWPTPATPPSPSSASLLTSYRSTCRSSPSHLKDMVVSPHLTVGRSETENTE